MISHIWNIGKGPVIPSLCRRKFINREDVKEMRIPKDAAPCRHCIAADIKMKLEKRERELKHV